MIKTVFVFDTVLVEDNNNYFGMTLTYDFFHKRYIEEFENITVTTRVIDKEKVKGNIEGYKITNGPNVNVIPIREYNNILDAFFKYRRIEEKVNSLVKDADIVILRMPSVLSLFAYKCAKKNKKKYFIELVACPWDGYSNHTHWAGKLVAPIMYMLTKQAVKRADNVLYVTKEFLQKRYPTKGNSISCSDVVLKDFDNDTITQRIERIKKQNENKIKLCTVANVELKYKGQEYVMKAMKELEKRNIDSEYYLVGGGNNQRLKEIAKQLGLQDKIFFVGSLPHNKVFDILDDIDVYIQPSFQEGLPRSLIEAMSRGCPAIGFKTGGIPELLQKDFILNKKDYKGIANKVQELLNKEKRMEISKENFETARNFKEEILEKTRKEFYKNIKFQNIQN